MAKIALISCVKEKSEKACPAKEMYLGKDFNSWQSDAEKKGVDYWYILSGKYGLLSPDEVIEPYDVNLNHATEKVRLNWAREVITKLRKLHDTETDHFILYANKNYYANLIREIKHFEIPLHID